MKFFIGGGVGGVPFLENSLRGGGTKIKIYPPTFLET
jgi:hypothetical protein